MSRPVEEYGRVGVLMGGQSAERDVSLRSGEAVFAALESKGVDAVAIDVDHEVAASLRDNRIERAFIALHGRGGEDGVMQGLLEAMAIPYTGSRVLGSAISMDKLRTKQIWSSLYMPTPDYRVLGNEQDCETACAELGLPLIIKPAMEGSSIGMSKVESADEMLPAFDKAREYGIVIAERWITGREFTAAILHDRMLPMIRLETSHAFYDYEAKYVSDDTRYICPCGLDPDREQALGSIMKQAFDVISAKGWGRVDFMLDDDDRPWLIEVNTVPGMTDHSLVPMAARQSGIGFEDLVLEILETSYV